MLANYNQEVTLKTFNNFIAVNYVASTLTEIQNRSKILDDSKNLKCLIGFEKIEVIGVTLKINEFGPLGENVYEASNKDTRVRFVGLWNNFSDTNGVGAISTKIGNFIEVEFYGTGLTALVNYDANPLDVRVKIDVGVEGANIVAANNSSVISTRSLSANQPMFLTNGLSLGWHKVRIRHNSTHNFRVHGFNIINDRQNILVTAGKGYVGHILQNLAVATTTPFNAGVSGTKGARIVKYLKDTVVSQSVNESPAAPSYLTNTNHANEEEVRRVNWREYGNNRNDDFSAVSGAGGVTRTWVKSDNSHALFGATIAEYSSVTPSGVRFLANGNSLMYHFVGTGLDIIKHGVTATVDPTEVFIDGYSIGFLNATNANDRYVVERICSGLPAGVHTVKFLFNGSDQGDFGFIDFISYQISKPVIPYGALELCDYLLNANFILNTIAVNGLIGLSATSEGVIRKFARKELSYFGSWAYSPDTGQIGGAQVYSTVIGDYYEFEFYGTGFVFRGETAGGSCLDARVSIDGSTNLSALTFTGYGGMSVVNQAIGQIEIRDAGGFRGAGLAISGLSLGWHRVRITGNDANFFYADAFDLICPIYSIDKAMKKSESLKINQEFTPVKKEITPLPTMQNAKAWVIFDGPTGKIVKSHNVSGVLNISTGQWKVFFTKPFKDKDYVMVTSAGEGDSSIASANAYDGIFKNPNSIQIAQHNSAGTLISAGAPSLVFFGELYDE